MAIYQSLSITRKWKYDSIRVIGREGAYRIHVAFNSVFGFLPILMKSRFQFKAGKKCYL